MARNKIELLRQDGLVEPYRALHSRIFARQGERAIRTVLFTASHPREGRSTVAGNLAIYLSQIEPYKVLLLELDILHPARRPVIPVNREAGLSDFLAGAADLEQVIQQVPDSSLYVLPGGSVREGVPALLSDRTIGDLLQRLKAEFGFVIADGPTVNGLPPILPLIGHFDGVVLVAQANRTRRQVAARSVERLRSASNNFLGVVMNQRRFYIPGWIYRRL